MQRLTLVLVCATLVSACAHEAAASDPKPIVLDATYEHDRFGIMPGEIVRQFRAYTVSFDSPDDDDGDGTSDNWAIPTWVQYEIKEFEGDLGSAPARPDWFTDDNLHSLGIAGNNDSYHFSNVWRAANPDSPMLGYDRGHMCRKYHAFRLGDDADWNTHTVLNACPQKSDLNQGIWLDLENKCSAWADEFSAVWVMCGPIVSNNTPSLWIGQDGEIPVVAPDAFYKIVVKDAEDGGLDILAFVYPQEGENYRVSGGAEYDHTPHLVSVQMIEALTGLDFFSNLPATEQAQIESVIHTELWEE